jgi:hypothetical protein
MGDFEEHGGERASMNYPLTTSPIEDMMKVLPANRPL